MTASECEVHEVKGRGTMENHAIELHARIAELERENDAVKRGKRGAEQMLADALEANHRSLKERDSALERVREAEVLVWDLMERGVGIYDESARQGSRDRADAFLDRCLARDAKSSRVLDSSSPPERKPGVR